MGALRLWLFFGIGYKALDIFITLYLVITQGNTVESNPFALNMMYAYGVVPGLIFNGAIIGALLLVLYKYKEKELLILSTFLLMIPVILDTLKILGF